MMLIEQRAGAIPITPPTHLDVVPGPVLLADLEGAGTVSGHRARWGQVASMSADELLARVTDARVAGRGGAGFPFARKLALAARATQCRIVVNAAEGEPASAKDAALLTHAPHRVLDGAAAAATALRASTVDIVLPGDRPAVTQAVCRALADRRAAGDPLAWRTTIAQARFVAGQESAVLQALAGAPGMPVTSWAPAAQADRRGRATLLSNAETWAHVGALLALGRGYTAYGLPDERGTTLLTLRDQRGSDGGLERAYVREVEYGTPWAGLVPAAGGPRALLLGGYHGTWARVDVVRRMAISRADLAGIGATLGAGVVFAVDSCPVALTARIVAYLAGESAGRCGPCWHGLPVLAERLADLAAVDGAAPDPGTGRAILDLAQLVTGRGACKHPDGTARLVRSLFDTFPNEVDAHRRGGCGW